MRRKDRSEQADLRAGTAERLEAIVEAAERAAESVIDDAEAKARSYLAEAEAEADREASGRLASLAELTDLLLEQSVVLRRQAEQLQATLEESKRRIEAEGGAAPAAGEPEGETRAPHLTAVAPLEPREGEHLGAAGAASGTPAGARLLATQLAISGHSREEIEDRLRNGFQLEDTNAILDAILGPED